MVLISPTGRQKGIKIDGIRMADQFCGIWHSDSTLPLSCLCDMQQKCGNPIRIFIEPKFFQSLPLHTQNVV